MVQACQIFLIKMAKQISNYSNPALLIDRSAELLSKEFGKAAATTATQLENIRISKNQAAEEEAKFDKLIHQAAGGEGLGFKDELQNLLSSGVDDNYVLGVNSIGRDQTDYIRNTSQLQSTINQLPNFLAMLDQEAKNYGDAMLSDPNRKVLNSTDPLAREFMEDIRSNNGNNIKPSYENGNIILTYTNDEGKKYVLNSANYQKARENGVGDIIKYTKDHNPEYKSIFDTLATKDRYQALTQQITSLSGEGEDRTKYTTLKQKWDTANSELRNDLMTNTTLAAMVDESAFQALNPGEVWTGSEQQIKDTREQVVDYIMDQYANENRTLKYLQSAFPETKTEGKEKISINYDEFEILSAMRDTPTGEADPQAAAKWLEDTFVNLPIIDAAGKQRFIKSVKYDENNNEYVPIYEIEEYDKKTGQRTIVEKELGSYSPTQIVNEAITLRVKTTQVAKDRLSVL